MSAKNRAQAIEWLKAALLDLKSIEKIIDDEFLTPIAAFHAQQAVEKSLKAIIEYEKIEISKTHNLRKLYKNIKHLIELDENRLDFINELYIDSRYPGDMGLLPYGKPTLEDAREFYEFAQNFFDKVCEILTVDKDTLLK